MSPAKPAIRSEVRYVLDALKSAIRILGYTVRDIENKLRYSHGYLSRVFGGTIELKMEHVIDIARALEVEPEELLAFVYPTLKDPASPAAYELWQRVGGQPPVGTFVIRNVHKQSVTDEELERALRRTLGNVLSEISGHLAQVRAEPAAEEAKPAKSRKPSKKP
jgi:transcriptional regulator with XRE-family HTH domain